MIYLVLDGGIAGYATTVEKAQQMVDKLKQEYGEEFVDYKIIPVKTDVLCIDDQIIKF